MTRLKAAGVCTEDYTSAHAPHSFCLFEPWFSPTVTRIQAFLARTLGQP